MKRLPRSIRFGDGDAQLSATSKGDGHYEVRVGDETFAVEAGPLEGGGFWFRQADGRRHTAWVATSGEDVQARVDGRTWAIPSAERVHGASGTEADPTRVVAPMTGTVVKLLVGLGDAVTQDQDILVLTAMKMEHKLRAAGAGTVAEILTEEGATVEAGTLLVRLDESV